MQLPVCDVQQFLCSCFCMIIVALYGIVNLDQWILALAVHSIYPITNCLAAILTAHAVILLFPCSVGEGDPDAGETVEDTQTSATSAGESVNSLEEDLRLEYIEQQR